MKPSELARLLNVSGQTVRRWSDEYREFLSISAAPPVDGDFRNYAPRDQQVIRLIADLRAMNQPRENIIKRLEEERLKNWSELAPLPDSWLAIGDQISVTLAEARTNELVTIAALQAQLTSVTSSLQEAQRRAETLAQELEAARSGHDATEARIHGLELELERARTEVASLQGQLTAYSFGREKPLNIGVIIIIALATGAALVALAVLLGALLG